MGAVEHHHEVRAGGGAGAVGAVAGGQEVDGATHVASQDCRRTEQLGGHLGPAGLGEDGDDPLRLPRPAASAVR